MPDPCPRLLQVTCYFDIFKHVCTLYRDVRGGHRANMERFTDNDTKLALSGLSAVIKSSEKLCSYEIFSMQPQSNRAAAGGVLNISAIYFICSTTGV